MSRILLGLMILLALEGVAMADDGKTIEKMIAASRDIWGEAAMRRPNGASYEFFEKVIPPLRYTNAEFKRYPIVLGMPGKQVKARLISDGSAVNARANNPSLWLEVGFPVTFSVDDGEIFGKDLSRLDGPRYAEGYLPIVQMKYSHAGVNYAQEAFACTEQPFSDHGAVVIRFQGKGRIAARIGAEGEISAKNGLLTNSEGKALVWFSRDWEWNSATRELTAAKSDSFIVIFTEPMDFEPSAVLNRTWYDSRRRESIRYWDSLLSRGTQLEVPEPLVSNAWRSLIIGTFVCLKGNDLNYSAGNLYERQFGAECGDAVRALLLFGYKEDARKMLPSLLAYYQQGVVYHDAGFKLQLLSHYYWLTRDADFVKTSQARCMKEADYIINNRETENGLLPRENYCGDIETQVYSLNSNANAWRGLRDFSAVLEDIGEAQEARRLSEAASEYRIAILKAVEKSERTDVSPTFIPNALFGEEEPYQKLTETKMGSYWDLLIPYVLGSGVFGDDSERVGWILDYLHQRGGICMGLVRFFWESTDDLYGLRYVTTLLRRDEVDRAQVSFYGKLALGLTHDTFIGGEGCRLPVIDEFGRHAHLPPNSASNAHFLWTLRYLMVQDWDMDDDGKPETLRLMFATPKRWLEDGKTIKILRAPTAFGEVSVVMRSHLRQGEVTAEVTAPPRNPKQTLLRARPPAGWRVVSAHAQKKSLPVDERGTVDVTGLTGRFRVSFEVQKDSPGI